MDHPRCRVYVRALTYLVYTYCITLGVSFQQLGVDKNCCGEQPCQSLTFADSGKLGESDCSAILLAADFELDGDECLGHVPETAWDVPEIPSPPTASGLDWTNNYQHQMETTLAFVPDVCYSTMQDQYHDQHTGSSLKRRRD